MRVLFFICSLFLLNAYAHEKKFQNSFPTIKNPVSNLDELLHSSSDLILVYTLPRTGTSITIAILNQITGRNCIFSRNKSRWKQGVILNRAMVDITDFKIPILATHAQSYLKGLESNKLICLIRDYREWFSRVSGVATSKYNSYMDYVEFYDKWPENKKFLIKFEDILE